jgi:hypothetical protein
MRDTRGSLRWEAVEVREVRVGGAGTWNNRQGTTDSGQQIRDKGWGMRD